MVAQGLSFTSVPNRATIISGHLGGVAGDSPCRVAAAGGFVHPTASVLGGTVATISPTTTDTVVSRLIVPRAATIRNLHVVQLAESAAGDLAVTVYKNGSSTALTVTCTALSTLTSDTTNSVSVAAGDYLQMFLDDTNVGTVDLGLNWQFTLEEVP